MNSKTSILFLFLWILATFSACEFMIHRMPNPRPTTKNYSTENQKEEKSRGELRFIVIGDWGEKGNFFQRQVASAMNKIRVQQKIDFILTTGDNFYQTGVNDVNDPHFQESFEIIYSASNKIPWYIALGNHDYMGNIQSLIDYSEKNSFWIFPSPYYFFEKNLTQSKKVLFVITDTNEFIHFLGFRYRSYMRRDKGIRQLSWINAILRDNSSQWKIVVGHHPVYSAGNHGDTVSLQSEFLDNLENNGVDLYFSGHDHDLQFLKNPSKRTNFFISGASSKVREMKSNPYSIFAKAEAGFIVVTLKERDALVQFIDKDAKEIFRTNIQK